MTDADRGVDRAKNLANLVARTLNSAAHPADALTALQLVVASTLETLNIPPEIFMHRVIVTIERIRSGAIVTKEPGQ